MNYKKILKIIIGCFFVLVGIMGLFDTIIWLVAKGDYNEEYVYSDLGTLYYEKNNEKIYIEKMYNTDGEILELSIPDKKTIIMYCYKDNPAEGIFLGVDNTSDWGLQYPVVNIYISVLFLIVALFILFNKNNENPIINGYLFYLYFFAVGIGFAISQIYNVINYGMSDLNIFMLILGILITVFTFPIVFFNSKMASRFNKAVRKK